MALKVVMRYGKAKGERGNGGLPILVEDGDLEFDEDIEDTILDFDAGGLYLLVLRAYNKNTDARSGETMRLINVPSGSAYGTTAPTIASAASGGSGFTIDGNTDSTVTIKPSGVNYHVRYALYKMA